MAHEHPPVVDEWYENGERQVFSVVALDEDEGLIEIQYFEGEVEEIEFDSWYAMDLQPIDPPEDWTGPFDDLEDDDISADSPLERRDWGDAEDHLDLDE